MSGYQDVESDIPEADRIEQQLEPSDEPADPERVTGAPDPGGVEANPADVVEQTIEVPGDDDERADEEQADIE